MAKKEKLHLQHSDELEAVDAELASAMELLDQANERVDGVLRTIDIVMTPGQAELIGSGSDSENSDVPDEAKNVFDLRTVEPGANEADTVE